MADRIFANTDTYQQIARRLNILAQELGDAASSLSRVNTDQEAGGRLRIGLGGRLRSTGASMPDGQIASIVRSMRSIIRGLRDHTGDLADNVRKAADLFENVEQELARLEPGTGEDAVFSKGSKVREAFDRAKQVISEFVDFFFGEDGNGGLQIDGHDIAHFFGEGFSQWILGPMIPIALLPNVGPGSSAHDAMMETLNLGEFFGYEPIIGQPPESIFNNSIFGEYQLTDWLDGTVSDDMKGRLHDSTSVSAELSGSTSIFSWEGAVSNEHGSAQAHMDFMKAEGEMGASAQLFDEDGNFRPGAEAHIGGSVTLFEAGASGEYEIIDGVKAHGSANVTAGQVSGEAEVNLGFDENGNLNVNASASAEAILVEAKAEAGLDIAGVDVKASAGVNIGVGAHADVGYSDGVLKFDVGASLGIGVEVAFEVDIGGAIDNAKDFVNDTYDNIKGAAETFLGWIGF